MWRGEGQLHNAMESRRKPIVIVRVRKDGRLPHGGSVLFRVELPFKIATMDGIVARTRAIVCSHFDVS